MDELLDSKDERVRLSAAKEIVGREIDKAETITEVELHKVNIRDILEAIKIDRENKLVETTTAS